MRHLCVALVICAACQEYDVTPHRTEDVWFQEDRDARADVLFVVDDSASMVEEQVRLTDNFASFLDVLETTAADFRLGVVTTTAEDGGTLRGLFDPETPDLSDAVLDALLVGTDGSRDEQGLATAQLALDGRNEGFPRGDVPLAIVFVSDEDDVSPDAVEVYLTRYQEVTTALGVHGIVGDLPEGCATGTSAAAAGPRYIQAIAATGGHRASICADEYGTLLREVGLDVAGLPDSMPLSEVPQADSIEVTVDGVLLHHRDVDGWTWSPGDNTIVFHGRAIPRPGMTAVATYQVDLAAE